MLSLAAMLEPVKCWMCPTEVEEALLGGYAMTPGGIDGAEL